MRVVGCSRGGGSEADDGGSWVPPVPHVRDALGFRVGGSREGEEEAEAQVPQMQEPRADALPRVPL